MCRGFCSPGDTVGGCHPISLLLRSVTSPWSHKAKAEQESRDKLIQENYNPGEVQGLWSEGGGRGRVEMQQLTLMRVPDKEPQTTG